MSFGSPLAMTETSNSSAMATTKVGFRNGSEGLIELVEELTESFTFEFARDRLSVGGRGGETGCALTV